MDFLANLFQPSTLKGLAAIGTGVGLYSANVVDPLVTAAVSVYGLVDVFRNEYKKKD